MSGSFRNCIEKEDVCMSMKVTSDDYLMHNNFLTTLGLA